MKLVLGGMRNIPHNPTLQVNARSRTLEPYRADLCVGSASTNSARVALASYAKCHSFCKWKLEETVGSRLGEEEQGVYATSTNRPLFSMSVAFPKLLWDQGCLFDDPGTY